jgi:hypothetical protein
MKYKDKNLVIEAELIPLYDADRPSQALIDIFNPQKNNLRAQSQALVTRVNGILHELDEQIDFGIADKTLHCLMPILIYSRKQGLQDRYHSLSNRLSITDNELAKDLLLSAKLQFYEESKTLIDAVFQSDNFVYLVFNLQDMDTIFTAVDKLSLRKGAITVHNPEFKNTTPLMRYCLDRNIHLIENSDGSADIFRF